MLDLIRGGGTSYIPVGNGNYGIKVGTSRILEYSSYVSTEDQVSLYWTRTLSRTSTGAGPASGDSIFTGTLSHHVVTAMVGPSGRQSVSTVVDEWQSIIVRYRSTYFNNGYSGIWYSLTTEGYYKATTISNTSENWY